MNYFITSDNIGSETGGGVVTYNELKSLKDFSENKVKVINPEPNIDPFLTDRAALNLCQEKPKLSHFYAGTYSETIKHLKNKGTKISYTAAAHDIDLSRQEFESLGFDFSLPHLTNPKLLENYLRGYREADVIICPSEHSRKVMIDKFGCKNVKIVPHGCFIPEVIKPLPKNFTVGYLGQPGPDKGLIYLIKAWALLNYTDSLLIIAGRGTESLLPLVRSYGKGNINLLGFVKSPSNLYNTCSLYVQPSVTEGFGIEVLEAMAHGRAVVCSEGAGSADCVSDEVGTVVKSRNPLAIAEAIDNYKKNQDNLLKHGDFGRQKVKDYTWDKVREKYKEIWRTII